jgi:hypothetical protein
MAAPSTPAAQALLDALGDRPGATAPELAQAAGIGRSTAAKLLATLAGQGRVLRQPGGRRGGRPAADRWTLPTPDPTPDPGLPTAAPTRPPTHPRLGRDGWAPASCASWCWAAWPSDRDKRCPRPRSPRRWTVRPAPSPTPCRSWPAKGR